MKAGHGRLHGRRIMYDGAILSLETGTKRLEKRAVSLVSDLEQDIVDRYRARRTVLEGAKDDLIGFDRRRLGLEQAADLPACDHRHELRSDPVLHTLVELAPAIGDGHLGPAPERAKRGFAGRVPTAHDEDPASEVPVCLTEGAMDMGKILPGNAESTRPGRPTARDHEAFAGEFMRQSRERPCPEPEPSPIAVTKFDHSLEGPHLEIELLDDGTEIGKVLLPGPLFVGRGDEGHTGDREPFRRGEPAGARWKVDDLLPDRTRIELQVGKTTPFQFDGGLQADRPASDDDRRNFVHALRFRSEHPEEFRSVPRVRSGHARPR